MQGLKHKRLDAQKRLEALREEVAEGLLQEASERAAGTTTAEEHYEAVEAPAPQTNRKTRTTRKRVTPKRLARGNQRNKRSKALASDNPWLKLVFISFHMIICF